MGTTHRQGVINDIRAARVSGRVGETWVWLLSERDDIGSAAHETNWVSRVFARDRPHQQSSTRKTTLDKAPEKWGDPS